ncbi:MAG: PleD family two-component system response regulator [Hyphomicrobiaceae bacterium]|jgi:two-component system cell cycle response regulator
MTARVLVVDDIPVNVKLLEARLTAEYFEVLAANSGQQAIEICARERIDVVLLDVMMPGMDGFEACRRIKAMENCSHVPIVMVTALDQSSDRVQGLEAGADDFLTKPVDEIALITRVRNLARVKMLNDEMLMRATTSHQLGLAGPEAYPEAMSADKGHVLVVDDHPRTGPRLAEAIGRLHTPVLERDAAQALLRLSEENFDVVVVSLALEDSDALRLCSQIRALDRSRHLPIVLLVEAGEKARLLRGLDIGVNDYLMRPVDRNELMARLRTQIRRKRFSDFLRNRLEQSIELAATDGLTGLFNRRYMENHLRTLMQEARRQAAPLSLLIADIDLFKRVNDTYGHDAGDAVLKEFAMRLRRSTRANDLACRMGGEEFVMLMPNTPLARAYQVGERLRAGIAADPFEAGSQKIRVTASVGVAGLEAGDDAPDRILKRADLALYAAKREGRNRVIVQDAA